MSMIKNKADILKKLREQKEKDQKKIHILPVVQKLTLRESKEKAQKSFISTQKTLTEKSKNETDMREFLSQVVDIYGPDLGEEGEDGQDTLIIKKGQKAFIDDYVITKIKEDNTISVDDVTLIAKEKWYELNTVSKLKWIIQGYVSRKGVDYAAKNFSKQIMTSIKTEDLLRKFKEYKKNTFFK